MYDDILLHFQLKPFKNADSGVGMDHHDDDTSRLLL